MNVFLAVAENRAVCETLRTTLPKTDLLIFETSVTEAGRRLLGDGTSVVIEGAERLTPGQSVRIVTLAED